MNKNGVVVIPSEEYKEQIENIVIMERMLIENDIQIEQLKKDIDEMERKNEFLDMVNSCMKEWVNSSYYKRCFLDWLEENQDSRLEKLKKVIGE